MERHIILIVVDSIVYICCSGGSQFILTSTITYNINTNNNDNNNY